VLAPTVVIVGVLGVVLATIVAGLPPLVGQADALRAQIPEYVRQGVERNTTLRDLDERVGLIERVEDVTEEQAGSEVLQEQPPERVLGLAMGVAKGVFAVVTALVLMLYFLGNYRGLKRAAYVLVPRSRRARVTLLTDEILDRIGMYVLGNLATSAVAGVAAELVLWQLDVPYPIALGLFVALMDVVPLVGATIGAVVSSAMAFTVSAGTGIAAIAFFVVYQQFENFVLVPRHAACRRCLPGGHDRGHPRRWRAARRRRRVARRPDGGGHPARVHRGGPAASGGRLTTLRPPGRAGGATALG
jgi:predicted PurR-regulated permease PerM